MGDFEAFGKLELELRRGVVVLATLSQLRKPHYGYELRQTLAEKGMPIEEGTLYPLLRRLQTQGVLSSEWKIEDGPPRRYYALNADGRRLLARLTGSWQGHERRHGPLAERERAVTADDVIDSYVNDVASKMPRAQRNDVAFELRALLVGWS